MYNPWNAWFALSSQAARVCWATQAGMLRGIAQGVAKAEAETDRMVTENVGAAEAQISEESNKKHRGAKKALAIAAKRDRRNGQRDRRNRRRVRSGRDEPRVKKIQKRRPSGVRRRRIGGR
jgi:hypothetical protein